MCMMFIAVASYRLCIRSHCRIHSSVQWRFIGCFSCFSEAVHSLSASLHLLPAVQETKHAHCQQEVYPQHWSLIQVRSTEAQHIATHDIAGADNP